MTSLQAMRNAFQVAIKTGSEADWVNYRSLKELAKVDASLLYTKKCGCGKLHTFVRGIVCEANNLTFECECGSSLVAMPEQYRV